MRIEKKEININYEIVVLLETSNNKNTNKISVKFKFCIIYVHFSFFAPLLVKRFNDFGIKFAQNKEEFVFINYL